MSDAPPSYASWGLEARAGRKARLFDGSALFPAIGTGGILPYGNGRSYGDSCLNDSGVLIDSRRRSRILAFDATGGRLTAEAGILLCEITKAVARDGWFLPVTPGTQFVTLGGAIANDVHGKNHHRRGSFGRAVVEVSLLRSDRPGPVLCSPASEATLFAATIGGMGLTGLITQATIQLMAVPSTTIAETVTRFDRLSDYFDRAEAADGAHEYAVAWIDSLSAGHAFGRGHLICGDHAQHGEREGRARPAMAHVPLTPPISPLVGLALKAFNAAYFRKIPRGTSQRRVPFDAFFYPLDRITGWNRLYGRKGLLQHQSVVPLGAGAEAVAALLDCARAHKQGSFLTVLKRFGDLASPGLLGFARPGYTLTLDFPHRGARTLALLDDLDRITLSAGGAVNPYKDARMAPQTFEHSFPQWRELEALRDPAIVSDFWRRTAMRLA